MIPRGIAWCVAVSIAATLAGCAAPDLIGSSALPPMVSTLAAVSSPSTKVSTTSSMPSPPAGNLGTPMPADEPHAHPPQVPCTMPPPDLAPFVRSAAAVIDVVAPRTYTKSMARTPWGQPDPNPYLYRVTGAMSVIPETPALPTYAVDAPAPLVGGSEYILFLGRSEGTGFFVEDGLSGAFLISDGVVSFQCPNYDDPARPIQSSGRTVSVAAFGHMIRAVH